MLSGEVVSILNYFIDNLNGHVNTRNNTFNRQIIHREETNLNKSSGAQSCQFLDRTFSF
jgi:hypothetical protein